MAQLEQDRHYEHIVQAVGSRPVAALVAVVVVLVVVVLGISTAQRDPLVVQTHAGSQEGSEAGAERAAEDSDTVSALQADAEEEAIKVDVTGAVASPGVVELDSDARVIDAIEAAGGQTADADLSSINRAAKLLDGEKVHVPRVGEMAPDAADTGGGDGDAAASALVNINTAGLDELDELPGVGPSTAQAIIDEREQGGPFTSIEDIMRVSGIGEKKFEKLKSSIRI